MDGILEAIGVGASAASGGIFGVLGALGSSYFKWQKERTDLEHQRAEWRHVERLHELANARAKDQAEWDDEEREDELRLVTMEGSYTALTASHQQLAPVRASSGWVQDARALFRPVLTVLLNMMTGWLLWYIMSGRIQGLVDSLYEVQKGLIASGSQLDLAIAQAITDIFIYGMYSLVFTTATANAWWFAERAFSPKGWK